jgi:acetyl-CoA synthetase
MPDSGTPSLGTLKALGATEQQAAALLQAMSASVPAAGAPEPPALRWARLTRGPLTPALPFAVHQWAFEQVFSDWDDRQGPRPAWTPTADEAAATRIASLMRDRGITSYPQLHAWSIDDRAAFWGWAIQQLGLRFARPPAAVLEVPPGPRGAEHPRWLPGAHYNVVDSCFPTDGADGASGNRPALIWGGPDGAVTTLSYAQLAARVARVAAALPAVGFAPGDALAIDMPMTPESVIIYLGIVAAGMTVVSIADALAPDEVGTRLRIAGARGLFTVDAVVRAGKRLPLYAKVLEADPPRTIVLSAGQDNGANPGAVVAGLRAQDLGWAQFLALAPADAPLAPRPGAPETVTNILFSSGTTGEPKAIPWTQLTPIKAAIDAALHLDVRAGDVIAWPTNLGWMMGPWLIYASLLNRATMALFHDVPTGRPFGEFVARARVNVLGLVPSIVKAWRSDDRMRGLDWSAVKCFGSTGEASNATDYLYLMMLAGYRPVIEYCGGTEIGGGYLTGTLVQPASPATFSTPALGSQLVLLDEHGQVTDNGEVYLVPPTLGYSLTLLNRDHHEVYFAGTPPGPGGQLLRRHGDQIERLPGGYFRALGRVDDTMNLGGIKVSSAEIERVLDGVPGVLRTAAVAINPPGGGPSELVVFVVPREPGAAGGASLDRNALAPALQQALKTRLNPLFRISDVVLVPSLPVTPSNKIMRRELRAQYRPG